MIDDINICMTDSTHDVLDLTSGKFDTGGLASNIDLSRLVDYLPIKDGDVFRDKYLCQYGKYIRGEVTVSDGADEVTIKLVYIETNITYISLNYVRVNTLHKLKYVIDDINHKTRFLRKVDSYPK